MAQNKVNFENLHSNPFYNESFSGAKDEIDPVENFFNEVNTTNFKVSFSNLHLPNFDNILQERRTSKHDNVVFIYIHESLALITQ